MGVTEHLPVTFCPFRFGFEQIRDPPGADLADKQEAVRDPEPEIEPLRVRSTQIPDGASEADCATAHSVRGSPPAGVQTNPGCGPPSHGSNVREEPNRESREIGPGTVVEEVGRADRPLCRMNLLGAIY